MRPHTLAEARRRAQAGEPFDLAIGNFLQAYYLVPDIAARVPMLGDEPPLRGQALQCARRRHRGIPLQALGADPAAAVDQEPHPLPDRPWWPIGEGDPALMEYLTWLSPPEFASRNIMTDEPPLRRATQPPVEPLQ